VDDVAQNRLDEVVSLRSEGYPIEADAVAALSPHMTPHLNRFGRYSLDLSRVPLPFQYEAPILGAAGAWVTTDWSTVRRLDR
jgi:hypothetical protein